MDRQLYMIIKYRLTIGYVQIIDYAYQNRLTIGYVQIIDYAYQIQTDYWKWTDYWV